MATTIPITSRGTYAFLDPAGSRDKALQARQRAKDVGARANSAIVVAFEDNLTRLFTLYCWADQVSTATLIKKIYEVNDRFKPHKFGVEASAMQSLFADALHLMSRLQNKRVPFVAVEQPVKIDKDFRIRTAIHGPLEDGRLFFVEGGEGIAELERELRQFPHGRTKDRVDALASLINMVPKRAPSSTKSVDDDLVVYMREQGFQKYTIDKLIREVMEKK